MRGARRAAYRRPMTTQQTLRPHDVIDRAQALAPTITRRAQEIEAARRTPPDLVEQLSTAGCFRIAQPASHGGVGADLPTAMRVFEVLSRADASVGWNLAIGAGAWLDLVELPRATFDAMFAVPDPIFAGAFNPSGTAVRTDRGYHVHGRWAFASGCQHATWIYGNCMEESDGEVRIRAAVFAPDQIEIEDTWHVSGLRGTGSNHFHADVVLPSEWTCLVMEGEPCIDTPIVRIPIPSLIALVLATIAVGNAEGALDDVLTLATDKMPLLAGNTLVAQPMFQHDLAAADAEVRAARALLYEAAAEAWELAVDGVPFAPHQRARMRAAGAWATTASARVAATAYRAGGGSAIYDTSPLQRRLRDAYAITQHFLMREDTFTTAGALLAGQEIDVPVF